MRKWSSEETFRFFLEKDLQGPAQTLQGNGVNGADLLMFTETTLVQDVKVSPFAAQKVLRARDSFLAA